MGKGAVMGRAGVLAALVVTVVGTLGGCASPENLGVDSILGEYVATTGSAPKSPSQTQPSIQRTWRTGAGEFARWPATLPAGGAPAEASFRRLPYPPGAVRVGPAYPNDYWKSVATDFKELVPMVWDDTKATFTNRTSIVLLATSGAAGLALAKDRGNNQVADYFAKHHVLNTFWDMTGDVPGCPGTHFAVAGAMYFGSLAARNVKMYEVSKSLISALSINGTLTVALKLACGTKGPNGDPFDWPSGHTSSSFTFATVMYEHYGPWVGVPLLGFATWVGYERLAARNHDFNDVISGALIGIAIGHAVASHHQPKVLGMDVVPYVRPGFAGVALIKQW